MKHRSRQQHTCGAFCFVGGRVRRKNLARLHVVLNGRLHVTGARLTWVPCNAYTLRR